MAPASAGRTPLPCAPFEGKTFGVDRTRGPVFVLALAGAIALGGAVAYWLDRDPPRDGATRSGDGVSRRGELPPQPGDDGLGAGAREALGGQGHAGASEAAPFAKAELRGRVVDADGRALAGARVVLTRAEVRGFEVLDLGAEAAARSVAETESGADGGFRFELQRGAPVDVEASLAGYCSALRPDAYAGQELELVLAPGVRVFGTLTRAHDGAAVAGARVRVFREAGPASLERETESRADGGYELRIPFRDAVRLEVVPRELAGSGWIELEIGADDACRRDVALADGAHLSGRVVAADTGLPLADAEVGEGWWFRRTATTDARGEYRLDGFGALREVGARAHGYGMERTSAPGADADGVAHLDFALSPARAVHGRVVDDAGAPLAEVYVAAVAAEFADGSQRTDWLSTRTDGAGRYRIGDLSRALGHALLVSAPGYGTQVHDLPESELETSELELPDVVLRRPGLIAGRVEDAAGAALEDVEVELAGWNHDRFRFTKSATARARAYVDARKAHSDARGRFWFGDLAAGRYRLVTRVAGRPESAPIELELVTGELREDVVVHLDSGGSIAGLVQDEHGAPLAGVYVSAQGERLRDPAARPVGQVHVRTLDDGRFELAGLPEGDYTIRAYPLETPVADPAESWLPATIEHVATGAQPIRVELRRGATIRGRVRDATGAALAGWVVAAVAGERAEEYAQSDGDGRFTLSVPAGTSWTLELRGAPQGESFRKVFARREGVAAGTQELELRVEN